MENISNLDIFLCAGDTLLYVVWCQQGNSTFSPRWYEVFRGYADCIPPVTIQQGKFKLFKLKLKFSQMNQGKCVFFWRLAFCIHGGKIFLKGKLYVKL